MSVPLSLMLSVVVNSERVQDAGAPVRRADTRLYDTRLLVKFAGIFVGQQRNLGRDVGFSRLLRRGAV